MAEPFTAQNPRFFGFFSGLAVDNSGGAGGPGEGEQGRLYVSGEKGPIDAFKASGEFLWTLPTSATGTGVCGIAVDPAGHLWVGTGSGAIFSGGQEKVLEFDTTGAGAPSNIPINEFPVTTGNKTPCQLSIDHSGASQYVALASVLAGGGLLKYHGGGLEKTLTIEPTRGVAVDQSSATGHVFALSGSGSSLFFPFSEYDSSDTPVPGSPFGGELIAEGAQGIAYSPARDWVYVSERNSVSPSGPTSRSSAQWRAAPPPT